MDESLLRLSRALDPIGEWSGKIVAWMILPLMLGTSYEVISRYGFDRPTFWAYDLSYQLYGAHFMLGAAYCLLHKGHIRTDFFYENWSTRRQATIDSLAFLFLFFPGMIFFFFASWDNAYHSWTIQETSEASAWRPYIYPFKAVMPTTAVLLFIQGVSEFCKSLYATRTGQWP